VEGPEERAPLVAERPVFAEAGGWIAVGLANALFVTRLSSASSPSAEVAHHVVDLGHFVLLASLAALLRAASVAATARFALGTALRVVLGTGLLALVAAWALREDLAGFLERTPLPGFLPTRALVAVAFGAAYLAWSFGTNRVAKWVPAWASALGVLVLVSACNLVLPPDYPGAHFFVLALASRVGALGIERVLAEHPLSRRATLGALAGVGATAALAITVRPPASVWRRVFDVPASVAPNLLGPLLGPSRRVRATWVPREYAAWFHVRPAAPARAPYPRRLVPRNAIVVLVTIDALRADVALEGKYEKELPNLAALGRSSIRFVHTRSPSPSTLTTAMAVFTGKYYSETYWTKSGNNVLPTDDASTRWPALLSERGIRTVNAVGLRGLSKKTGVGRGFTRERRTEKDYGRARDLMSIVLSEVKALGDDPGFVYAHFVDSHAPYTLAGTDGTPFERYLGEVALVDRELGRLLELANGAELRERAVLFVSADHGEAFGEHGMNFHARSVYEELLRVPLFVKLPGGVPRDVEVPVGLVDLGPTVLDLYGVGAPNDFMGESLVPLLAGDAFRPTRPLAADSGRRIQALVFPDGVKAIRDLTHHTSEVYDLRRDPGELENLADREDFPAPRYAAALDEFFAAHTLERPGWEPPWRKF
jgi:hypothetical protein